MILREIFDHTQNEVCLASFAHLFALTSSVFDLERDSEVFSALHER